MISVEVYSTEKTPVGKVNLSEQIFAIPVRRHLYHQVVKWQLACRRQGTHSTKNRAAVRGGGKKPWRQKGTGRARAGSIRSPLWRHGGIIFGPQPRDYSYNLPRRIRKEALRSALAEKYQNNQLLIVDNLQLPKIRTKDFLQIMKNLGVEKGLIVIEGENENLFRSARNVKEYKVLPVIGINLYDLLYFPTLVITQGALLKLEERLKL